MPKRLGELLLMIGAVEERDLEEALAQQRQGERLGELLVRGRRVCENDVVFALAMQLGVPMLIDLDHRMIPPSVLTLLPHDFCERFGAVPFNREQRQVHVAMCDATNRMLVSEIGRRTGLVPKAFLCSRAQLAWALRAQREAFAEVSFHGLMSSVDGR
jgi:type IV pilus assembly protein PilB